MNTVDYAFAEKITNEFKISLKDLIPIINTIRIWKTLHPEKTNLPSSKRKTYSVRELIRILEAPEFKVTTIHLETPDDVIHLSENDPLFHYFNAPIQRLRNAFQKEMITADKQWSKQINIWGERQIFRCFISYFRNHDLNIFSQRAIIGLFLCHFGINGRVPIMTPDQWENNMIGDNYYDYLNFIVKYRHNKYLKEFRQ